MKRTRLFTFLCVSFLLISSPVSAALNLDQLPETDIRRVKNLLNKIDPVIKERDRQHTLATLTFSDLYGPLTESERAFLREFRDLDATALGVKIPFRGIATGKEELIKIIGQKVKVLPREQEKFGGLKARELSPQFLPPPVYAAYKKMMTAMKKDISRRLYIESGYRSSAYQLYLFVYYLKNHAYSIRETVKFVALPGYSEHGSVQHQAVDFISADGINGEDNPQEFEDLPEYRWLQKNAAAFGFVLSYPKTGRVGITYEPWHWRFEGEPQKDTDQKPGEKNHGTKKK